ncbi:archaemetzincin [Flavobacterium amniphilum]|uniref:archaemetzincin n=1 Tax=Flavobacterium amniphilum TaxID=1834035 RepID=UPI002029E37D|nr:archaemetzincin [Flavobacterium amniphilum]MCL9807552.1 archaemetzincin [Flavobacterium amniphilum]
MNKVTFLIAIISALFFSCEKKDEYQKLATNDILLEKPKSGDWLADHPEDGQTFEAYSKMSPMKPNEDRNKIYILPIGGLTQQEDSLVNLTVEYLNLFYGIKTVKMQSIKDDIVPKDKRRLNENGEEQLDASYLIHEVVPKLKPNDALAIMAITGRDLYPKSSWNFVFGLATYTEGIGISSMARYDPNNKDYRVGLRRIIKTSAHEIGHMFKMKHCTHALCVMNGVNSLSEGDSRPNTLCSICLKKMAWNLKFDNKERFKKLISFYEKHDLKSDVEKMKNQLELIE